MAGDDGLEEEVTAAAVDRAAGEQGKALERMTDHVEDQPQLSNSQKVQEALQRLLVGEQERAKAASAREKELAGVKLRAPEDVDLVAAELELDRKAAERRLREHGGDVQQALRSFVF